MEIPVNRKARRKAEAIARHRYGTKHCASKKSFGKKRSK